MNLAVDLRQYTQSSLTALLLSPPARAPVATPTPTPLVSLDSCNHLPLDGRSCPLGSARRAGGGAPSLPLRLQPAVGPRSWVKDDQVSGGVRLCGPAPRPSLALPAGGVLASSRADSAGGGGCIHQPTHLLACSSTCLCRPPLPLLAPACRYTKWLWGLPLLTRSGQSRHCGRRKWGRGVLFSPSWEGGIWLVGPTGLQGCRVCRRPALPIEPPSVMEGASQGQGKALDGWHRHACTASSPAVHTCWQ